MRQKKLCILITGIMLAGILPPAGIARAQDNATNTVRGKTYVCYFSAPDGVKNYEVTFSTIASISILDSKGYGLYLPLGSFFVGYYLELNALIWRSTSAAGTRGDLLDTHDILMIFTGIATGVTIQGTGLTWVDNKNRQPFVFFGYQQATQ